MTKRYAALARVSSREQEREAFSLEVQEDALLRYAQQQGGTIVKFYKIAETASKREERRAFKDLIAYARKHAAQLDGVLWLKVDRVARNLVDYVELERLEADHNLPVLYVSQPTENTPAGRMMRRTLANMAAFYTEQQSIDVREGIERRVENGLFPNRPPYGYRARRVEGRSIVEVDATAAAKVRRIFDLYACDAHTLDTLIDELADGHIRYTASTLRFPRSKLHTILRDRSYIGEVRFRGQWYPGSHEPIIDRVTFARVQAILGESIYRSHELVYAGEMITCGECGRPITGEEKTKQTKAGLKRYRYYRCSRYTSKGHSRTRINEAELDRQVLALFDRIRIRDDRVRNWFGRTIEQRTQARQTDAARQTAEIRRQMTLLTKQQERLLNLRLLNEIDSDTFAAKNTELRDQRARLEFSLEQCGRNDAERDRIATRLFELSQTLENRWVSAGIGVKRQLLDIVCLNFSLEGKNLVPAVRKLFSVLTEDLESAESRGDRI